MKRLNKRKDFIMISDANQKDQRCHFSESRRQFLKFAGVLGVLAATPAYAQNIFKLLDPEGKNKDLKKAQDILSGVGSIVQSAEELDYPSEFSIGESLALEGFRRYGMPVENAELQKYVNLVGNAVSKSSSRFDIPYYFVAVQSPLYNAFACPGGIIFISSALMKSMGDESQLAGVLAHEVSHVSHKHALQSIQRAKFFEGVGKISAATMKGEKAKSFQEMIGGLQTVLFDKGLDQNMEFEADLSGMDIAYRTGYDPSGFIRVLEILKSNEPSAQKSGSWFSTHPPLPTRLARCSDKLRTFPDAGTLARVPDRFARYKQLL